MNIQVNTDAHIDGHERLVAQVRETIEQALVRFKDQITRIEAHLTDENGEKRGQNDQRCMLEARLEGRQPLTVTDHAATHQQAVHGAAQKLARLLDSTLGREHDQREKTAGLPLSAAEPSQPR